ncbi:MAG: chromate transporter [Tenericutes bacterium GWD2_38_27]|nr:MAG: chromate transporter [Tenericutes bacterium GWD2_38_27]HBG32307.1 chromate transporter [Acholeplasmataceae bacterium]HCB66956.1 chromate transporter [Acholeplasmataceae bacterium]
MKKQHKLLELFWTFFKIGAMTFGGGLAMMPIMRREVVEKEHWVDDDDIIQILVISETTPGVFAVNAATFIGYKIAGFWGSVVATLGVVVPSFIIISIISLFIVQFKELTLVSYAFYGIQAGVSILILRAAMKLSKKVHFNIFATAIFAASIVVALFTGISVIYILIVSAILGLLYGFLNSVKEAKIDVSNPS